MNQLAFELKIKHFHSRIWNINLDKIHSNFANQLVLRFKKSKQIYSDNISLNGGWLVRRQHIFLYSGIGEKLLLKRIYYLATSIHKLYSSWKVECLYKTSEYPKEEHYLINLLFYNFNTQTIFMLKSSMLNSKLVNHI